jgi:antitoxin ParD1/3/4
MKRLISADEAGRLVQEREVRLASLDASIARGVADAEAGRVTPFGKAFDRLERKLSVKTHVKRP